MSKNEHDDKTDAAFRAVARIATMANGANKIAAALLTVAHWTGGEPGFIDETGEPEVLSTYKRMLKEVEQHDVERGL